MTYKAHPDDPSPSANAQTDVIVPAQVTVRAKRTRIRNGRSAVLSGRVAGPIPHGGVLVAMEVREPNRSVPVATTRRWVRTRTSGTFTLSYRFLRTFRPTTYRFRVVADEDSAFQYGRGASRADRHARQTMIRALFIALAIALLAAAPAAADQVEITAQAKAAKADFLLRATPPGPAATICLVDTGSTSTPTRRASSVVCAHRRRDRPEPDASTERRWRCSSARRPTASGWSAIWPAARILSVRANVPGQDAFTAAGYINGVKRCDDAARLYGIKIVVLPFSSEFALDAGARRRR